jgi:hypothetical protein
MAFYAHHGGWILEEAAMAETPFNAADRKAQAREKLEAALAAYDKMLDTFVHHPMPPAAVEVGQVATRLVPGAASKTKKTP